MNRFLIPLGSAILLVVGCSQNVTAENSERARTKSDQAPTVLAQRDGGAASPATTDGASTAAPGSAPGPAEAGTCVVDGANSPCTASYTSGGNGAFTASYKVGGKTVKFAGKRQGAWWSGTLNGKAAMGYELNRGRVTISTQSLDSTFEYWSPGNEHGSY